MTLYEKILFLINDYLAGENDRESCKRFCEAYIDMFYSFSAELEKTVSQDCFDRLDDLNLICDLYEADPNIREVDKFCLDEESLRGKVISCLKIIENQ